MALPPASFSLYLSLTLSVSGQDSSGQVGTGRDRSGQAKIGQTGQDRSGDIIYHHNYQKTTLKQFGFDLILISLHEISKILNFLNLCLALFDFVKNLYYPRGWVLLDHPLDISSLFELFY